MGLVFFIAHLYLSYIRQRLGSGLNPTTYLWGVEPALDIQIGGCHARLGILVAHA